jgi:hypothetical protein
MNGEKKSWVIMKKYNIQDVVLLEKVYNKLKPWIKTYPKIVDPKADDPERECERCGKQCQKAGIKRLINTAYTRLYCLHCGHWQRGSDIVTKGGK